MIERLPTSPTYLPNEQESMTNCMLDFVPGSKETNVSAVLLRINN